MRHDLRVLPLGFRPVRIASVVLLSVFVLVTLLNVVAGFNEMALLLRMQGGERVGGDALERSDLLRSYR